VTTVVSATTWLSSTVEPMNSPSSAGSREMARLSNSSSSCGVSATATERRRPPRVQSSARPRQSQTQSREWPAGLCCDGRTNNNAHTLEEKNTLTHLFVYFQILQEALHISSATIKQHTVMITNSACSSSLRLEPSTSFSSTLIFH
jgi:hypothetical protein